MCRLEEGKDFFSAEDLSVADPAALRKLMEDKKGKPLHTKYQAYPETLLWEKTPEGFAPNDGAPCLDVRIPLLQGTL
jgi:hypothetical protein